MSLRTGHVGLNVADLDRSIAFYRDVLGFPVLAEGKEEGRRFAFLGEGPFPVLTLWQQAQGTYDGGRAGLHHLALELDTVEQVREYETALRAHGAEFAYEGLVAHWEGAASGGIFFKDPDGTRLEIYVKSGAEGAPPAPATTGGASAQSCGFF